jgi:hypothetical protein
MNFSAPSRLRVKKNVKPKTFMLITGEICG